MEQVAEEYRDYNIVATELLTSSKRPASLFAYFADYFILFDKETKK